ncbi:DegT/DnrJ/EryC1/StrS family aminotransferase [Streptomyces agglomeratus]|uniref:DegT/DnrJ/EryC1/StrS family aminotransferase n=1 Tax=Streptomyces agglomeratus TaxID=285458 RepID=UPI0019CF9256|nr:DegT/DnrJ/EryC1/StrS family aminotransferase [Streptomyces agglomeratus]
MTVHRLHIPPRGGSPAGRTSADDGRQQVPFAAATISGEARRAAQRVLASGWLTTGRETQRFEEEFAAYVGARHAVAVSSCTRRDRAGAARAAAAAAQPGPRTGHDVLRGGRGDRARRAASGAG